MLWKDKSFLWGSPLERLVDQQMPKARTAGRAYWLVFKQLTSRMEVFTTHLRGGPKALVVFSYEEEAEMFLDLRLTASKDRWRVRQTSVGELVSVLYGPCSDTKKVVLDPLPEIGGEALADLLSMHRAEFLRFLLGKKDLRTYTSFHSGLAGLKS
jgi:hypothetical protein